MLSILLAVHFVVTLLMIGLILIQKHEGGGLAGGLSSAVNGLVSSRGQANILTKATAILMTIFIANCLIMAKMVKGSPRPQSIIDAAASEYNVPKKDDFDQTAPGAANNKAADNVQNNNAQSSGTSDSAKK